MSSEKPRYLDSIWNQCKRKLPYDSMETAEKVAKKRTKAAGHLIHAYWCMYCAKYHIGRAEIC